MSTGASPSSTRPSTTWSPSRATARETYARFRKGDSFVASGHVPEKEVERDGSTVINEEFVARKIGHNANKTANKTADEVQRRRLAP